MIRKILRIQCLILSIVFFLTTIFPAAHARNIDLNQTVVDLNEVEEEIIETHGQSYLVLQEYGEKAKQEILQNLQVIIDESRSIWDKDLDVYISIDADIETKRRRLKNYVEVWRGSINPTTIKELRDGIADALAVARADGLDVEKFVDIYDEMKKAISHSSFIKVEKRSHIRNRSTDPLIDWGEYYQNLIGIQGPIILVIHLGDVVVEFGQHLFQDGIVNLGEKTEHIISGVEDHRPTTQVARGLLELLAMGEEMRIIRERLGFELEKYRSRLYKRAAIAFIRTLIYADELPMECDYRDIKPKNFLYLDEQVTIPECPDSAMVKGLRDYLHALRNIQGADAFGLQVKVEELINEQEMAEFFISFLPLVGESVDLYVAYNGEDLAGYCVHGFERALRLFFGMIPLIGPHMFKYIVSFKKVRLALIDLGLWCFELPHRVHRNLEVLGLNRIESLAKYYEIDSDILKQFRKKKDEILLNVDEAAKSKQITWRKIREQYNAEELIERMPREIYDKAVRNSDEIMRQNLLAKQGSRAERIADSNMVDTHIPELEQLVIDEDAILIYRAVNPDATEKLRQGVRTKWMNVKGKSSDWGVTRAYIPVDQKLSKLGNPSKILDESMNVDDIIKFYHKVEECLDSVPPCAKKTHLMIDDDPVMIVQRTSDDLEISAIFDENTGRYFDFAEGGGRIDITDQVRKDIEPRKCFVLADNDGFPLTADYDFADIGFKGRSRGSRMGPGDAGEMVPGRTDTLINDPERGFITERQLDILGKANRAINKGGYNKELFEKGIFVDISHHGAESGFPFSPGALAQDPYVAAFDPIYRELMIIKKCEYDCMLNWCETSGKCGGFINLLCKTVNEKNCIPPDPDRLYKDYIHDRRLQKYTVGPNSEWAWGHYNPAEGWSMLEYVAQLKKLQGAPDVPVSKGKPTYTPPSKSYVGDGVRSDAEITGTFPRPVMNVGKEALEKAVMTCREREH